MMSKFCTKTAFIAALTLALSGCLAAEKLDYQLMKQEDAKWIADERLTDTLVAIGKPSSPIEGVDNALVFAGEKYSYLVQSGNRDDELINILEQVDLAYFSFKPMPAFNAPYFRIRIGEQGCTSVQGCIAAILWFEKPTHLLAADETIKLETLDFTCHDGFPGGMTRCTKDLWRLPVTIAPAVKNIESLQYRLSQPTPIKFYTYQPNKALAAEKRLEALMPLAKAFDIITFPIQVVMLEGVNQ